MGALTFGLNESVAIDRWIGQEKEIEALFVA
jgi:hypothetical protein